jgi:class 3 adenylate cyclase/TolB-like protein
MARKLAAILVADFVGSTAQMAADEEAAIARISSAIDLTQHCIHRNGGRVFNTAGDSVLAEFPSPVGSLRAALETRAQLGGSQEHSVQDMRFGLHVADVVADGADLKGDGVNMAARLQSVAEPGQILVSDMLCSHVRRVSPCRLRSLGEVVLKGFDAPVPVWSADTSADRHVFQVASTNPAPRSEIRPNSLAVLPFRLAGAEDDDQRFLAVGLSEDLIHELGQFRSLFVSSRTASQTVEGEDPVAIGQQLGVRFILSGSLRKLGDMVWLNITLSSAETGEVIWSDRIKRSFDEILEAMDDIIVRVAATVSGRIDNAGISAARLKRPANMTAYEFYLRGLEHHRLSGADDSHVDKAIEWFHKAQAADPGFARPLAMEVCSASYKPDFDLAKAEKLLMRALELDPADPELHRILGIMHIKLHNDYPTSRKHHEIALQLSPNDAYIMGRCAAFYIFAGEGERALELLERAEVLDPFLPVWIVEERIAALYSLGRYDEVNQAALALPFQTRRTRCYRAATRVARGERTRAATLIAEALADDPNLSAEYIEGQELYQDPEMMQMLLDRLAKAGLPGRPGLC